MLKVKRLKGDIISLILSLTFIVFQYHKKYIYFLNFLLKNSVKIIQKNVNSNKKKYLKMLLFFLNYYK
jgi:hypothetical protein